MAGLKEAINEDTKAQAEPHTVYVMCKHRQVQIKYLKKKVKLKPRQLVEILHLHGMSVGHRWALGVRGPHASHRHPESQGVM